MGSSTAGDAEPISAKAAGKVLRRPIKPEHCPPGDRIIGLRRKQPLELRLGLPATLCCNRRARRPSAGLPPLRGTEVDVTATRAESTPGGRSRPMSAWYWRPPGLWLLATRATMSRCSLSSNRKVSSPSIRASSSSVSRDTIGRKCPMELLIAHRPDQAAPAIGDPIKDEGKMEVDLLPTPQAFALHDPVRKQDLSAACADVAEQILKGRAIGLVRPEKRKGDAGRRVARAATRQPLGGSRIGRPSCFRGYLHTAE